MRRDTRIQLTAALVAALCLASSVVLSVQLTATAGRAQLTYTDQAEKGDRWEVAAGIAMGAFRGMFVNMLWIRANDMKQAGKFFDAVELARAITRLQPRFPRVWVFHGWNLAYNISVATKTSQERWNWVNQGIAVLRDEGIPANPNDLLLHKELAWIYLHKIQGVTDDANVFYKKQIAAEWTVVLGPPPAPGPEDRDRDRAIARRAAWLQRIVDGAPTIEEVVRRQPAAAQLVDRLRSEFGQGFETPEARREFLSRYESTRAVKRSSRRFAVEQGANARTRVFFGLVDDATLEPVWDELLRCVRRRVLVDDYHMEPERMLRYTNKYGPVDWRHAAAHSLYWSARGVELASQRMRKETREDFDFTNTDRLVAQSVQELFRNGDLYFDFATFVAGGDSNWLGVPNGHFAIAYGNILEEMRGRSELYDKQRMDRGYSPLSAGYENFMVDVVLYYYRRGERALAEQWQKKLREFPQQNLNDPRRVERFSLPLDEFAQVELVDSFARPSVAVAHVEGALMSAFATGLLGGDSELFSTQFEFARMAHRYYFEKQRKGNPVNVEDARMDVMPPDFREMAGTVFYGFMSSLGRDDAETVYGRAPNDLRLWAYDALTETYRPEIDGQVAQGGKPFDIIFPRPGGLDEFHAEMLRIMSERQGQGVSVEQK